MHIVLFAVGLALGAVFCSLQSQAQSPFLDFGASKQEDRQDIQQWYIEKEIRNGNNPYSPKPCDNTW